MAQYFDSHAHLTSADLYGEADALLARAAAVGVTRVANICTDALSLQRGLTLAERHPEVINTAAVTPHDVAAFGEAFLDQVSAQARAGGLSAVGETGLDYYYEHSDRSIQQTFLRRHLALALECQLPIVIHCREAFADLFSILDVDYQIGGRCGPAILHCFTGTLAEAEGVLQRGMYLSLSGIVTYKKSEALRDVAKIVPLDQLLIETDAPYLAPQSRRGKVNEPAYITETAEIIARVKGLKTTDIAQATYANASRLFRTN